MDSNSALLLVDVLNDFLAQDGKLTPIIGPMVAKTNLIEQLLKLVAGARAAGVKIVYVPHGNNSKTFKNWKFPLARMAGGVEKQVFWEGSKGAEFYPALAPQADDTIINRHQLLNGFVATNLDVSLRQMGIEKLAIAGLTSGGCVEATGRYAVELGYHVTFINDAVADFDEASHRAAIEFGYKGYGHKSSTVTEYLSALV